jgi:hypothetical protein
VERLLSARFLPFAERSLSAQGRNRSRGRGGERAERARGKDPVPTRKPGPVSRSWGSTPCETGAFDVQEAHQPAASALDRRHDGVPVQRLRSAIARERGIAAYRAWLPLERIRPRDIPQDKWEGAFAWPPGNVPPYPPLLRRIARAVVIYALVFGGAAVLLQLFTPFPILTWIGRLIPLF